MNPNTALAVKINRIQGIQSQGFRVFLRQDKRAVLWRRAAPEREWRFGDLESAWKGCKMLNWITSQGWTVEIKGGLVICSKGASVADFRTLKAAYFGLGGPKNSCIHNPKNLKP